MGQDRQRENRIQRQIDAADADYLITGDRDFSETQKLLKTTILSVSQSARLVMK